MYKDTATELNKRFIKGEISAKEIAENLFKRIEEKDLQIQAFLSLLKERTFIKAKELDQKRSDNIPLGKLAGVPIALKDNMHIKGELTTCGSKFLSNYRASFDATVVRFLEQEDALIIGKTNLDEFAMGSSTENSAFFPSKNPWDITCSPGGSSGGSAAAVAARLTPIALGTDTGGSIRHPAALCGVVGFKPTYGRVSRHGLVGFASSLDQIGPLSRTVEDTAYIMEVIGRYCDKDTTSLPVKEEPYQKNLRDDLKGIKIGIPWHFLENMYEETKDNFQKAVEVFQKELNAQIVTIDLSLLKYSAATYQIIGRSEASISLARFNGIHHGMRSSRGKTLEEVYKFSRQEGFGKEVKKRLLLGTYILSFAPDSYLKAQKVRTLIIEQFARALSCCDLILMPTSPFEAFPLKTVLDPLQMYLQDIYTIGASLAGLPALSIPSGFAKDHKPFGIQLIGKQLEDGKVLACGHAFQKKTAYHQQIPPLFK